MPVMDTGSYASFRTTDEDLVRAAKVAIEDVLGVQAGESALIVTNPVGDVLEISEALYDALVAVGAKPTLMVQPVKTQLDFAEPGVIGAIEAEPDIIISMSAEKLGKDAIRVKSPIEYQGKTWDNYFHFLMHGKKTTRSFWSPAVTKDIFVRTVPIDYGRLKNECLSLRAILDRADEVHITAPAGTDLTFGLRGRTCYDDNGDFRSGGTGGNLPAGESYISPENGTARGVLVFDGSIAVKDGGITIDTPIRTVLEEGFITEITGGKEAETLLETITLGEDLALQYEEQGKIPAGQGPVRKRNARHLGELGIGLNPKAGVIGNILEDEKAYRTCHIAIGSNYDDDAPALIHLDGIIREPTITARFPDGTEQVFMRDGDLVL